MRTILHRGISIIDYIKNIFLTHLAEKKNNLKYWRGGRELERGKGKGYMISLIKSRKHINFEEKLKIKAVIYLKYSLLHLHAVSSVTVWWFYFF